MKKLFEITEKDNLATAFAKGGLKGTLNGTLLLGGLWTVVLITGKMYKKQQGNKEA